MTTTPTPVRKIVIKVYILDGKTGKIVRIK